MNIFIKKDGFYVKNHLKYASQQKLARKMLHIEMYASFNYEWFV